jgi:hypothetical protein
MQTQPVFIAITKSGLTIRPEGSNLLLVLVNHCIKDLKERIAHLKREAQRARQAVPEGVPQEEVVISDTQHLLESTQLVAHELEQLEGRLVQMYEVNYVTWAEGFRAARIRLGLKRIEDSPHLMAMLDGVAKILKGENHWFSSQKFITYINN